MRFGLRAQGSGVRMCGVDFQATHPSLIRTNTHLHPGGGFPWLLPALLPQHLSLIKADKWDEMMKHKRVDELFGSVGRMNHLRFRSKAQPWSSYLTDTREGKKRQKGEGDEQKSAAFTSFSR